MSLYFTFYITVEPSYYVLVKYFETLFINLWSATRCSPHILILARSSKISVLQLAAVFVFLCPL